GGGRVLVDIGLGLRLVDGANHLQRDRNRQKAAVEDLPGAQMNRHAAVGGHRIAKRRSQLSGDGLSRIACAAGADHDLDALPARPRNGRLNAGGNMVVRSDERAVDVEKQRPYLWARVRRIAPERAGNRTFSRLELPHAFIIPASALTGTKLLQT